MFDKFGKNGKVVRNFLSEIQEANIDKWRTVTLVAKPGQAERDAARALVDAPISAAVGSAIDSAARKVIRSLTINDDDLPEGKDRFGLDTLIGEAVATLAVGSDLACNHRIALLEPFMKANFKSVARDMTEALSAQGVAEEF